MDYYEAEMLSVEVPQMEGFAGDDSTFWSQQQPILGADGTLARGGMWQPQREWWNLPNFIKVLVGGYGAGKTINVCKRAISVGLQNAPCPIAIVSPTFPIARHTIITTMMELLRGKRSIYGRRFSWSYNQTSHEFRIRFRGRQALIIIYSGDNPLSLRGPNLAAAYLDEPFIQEYEVFEQMIARVRHPHATFMEIGLCGTPEQLNWGYDLCVGEDEHKHDVGFVQASTTTNLVLDPLYVARLRNAYSTEAAEAYVDGSFRNLTAGAVYYAFDMARNTVMDELGEDNLPKDMPKEAELGVGMDFNVNPMSATVFWHHRDHMHYFAEYELPETDTEYMCSTLREKYGHRLNTVYPDASGNTRHTNSPRGRTDFWYIRAAGYMIDAPSANPAVRDRYNSVNGKLKSAKGRTTITIGRQCKRLIKYLSVHSHVLKNKQKNMTHLLDAFSYPIARLYPVGRGSINTVKLTGA